MNVFVNTDVAREYHYKYFYNEINSGNDNTPFCDDCANEMNRLLTSNEPIKRYQGE